MKILRIFPRKTSFTPKDDLVVMGRPELWKPKVDEVHISCVFTWDRDYSEQLKKEWSQYYPVVKIGGPAYGFDDDGFVSGRYIREGITFTSRGCDFKCPWCVSLNTKVLMANLTIKRIRDIQIGDEIIGFQKRGYQKQYRMKKTRVLAKNLKKTEAYRITLKNGQQVICSKDHKWLTLRGWKYTIGSMAGKNQRPYLTINSRIRVIDHLIEFVETENYMKGYLSGIFKGDGHIGIAKEKRKGYKNHPLIRLAITDIEALERTEKYLKNLGLKNIRKRCFRKSNLRHPKQMMAIQSQRWDNYLKLNKIIKFKNNDDFMKGFLAGFFDAEGSFSNTILRFANIDKELLTFCMKCLAKFNFNFVLEKFKFSVPKIRFKGNINEKIRFFNLTNPVIIRKKKIQDFAFSGKSKIQKIEYLGRRLLCDITTESENFFANGFASHNCLVPKMEGPFRTLGDITPGNVIQDNNILLANADHLTKVFSMLKTQRAVRFLGELDVRLLRDWHIEELASLRIKELWLALDNWDTQRQFLRVAKKLRKAGFTRNQVRCYVLAGFNEPIQKAEGRLRFAYECGALPFVQLYQPPLPFKRMAGERSREDNLFIRKWSRPAAIKSAMGD